jgi:AAHS family 4-hydroxybenzoate transporter-like MFS transporter
MNPGASASSETIDVQQFIDKERLSPYQWMIFILCFLIMIADGFDTAAIGFVAPLLSKEWGLAMPALAPAITASVVGLAVGALIAGPCADRWGRKPVLIASVVVFSVFTLACAWTGAIASLTMLRFLAGLGLGAATPNATTLLSEYLPSRRRAVLVNSMFCGFTLGAALGGFGAAAIIPGYGWRGVFLAGGLAPLVLALLAAFALPESIRFMVVRKAPAEKVKAILCRIAGVATIAGNAFSLPDQHGKGTDGSPVALILSRDYRVGTLALWLTYFMGMVVFYVVTSWMPTLVKDAGLSVRQASLLTALFPLGGALGAILCGWLMDRMNSHVVIGAAYFLAAVFIAALGQSVGHVEYLPLLTFVAGLFTGAALVSMPTLASAYYPTHGRASGVAWMLGIGRFGGIAGALLGGMLIQLGLSTPEILAALALPALTGASSVLFKGAAARVKRG